MNRGIFTLSTSHLKRAAFASRSCGWMLAVLISALLVTSDASAQTTYSNITASATGGINETATPCATPFTRDFVVGPSPAYIVSDVDIGVLMAHSYRGDLIMTLRSPAGTVVTFNNQTGGSAANFNALMSDEATTTLGSDAAGHTATAATITPPYANTRIPSAPLSAFDGQSANGTWQLSICDNANADVGTFFRAHLIITAAVGADLSLTKTVSNATPANGAAISYTLTVTNAASSAQAATGVLVQDILPTGFTFSGASGAGSYNSGTGIWTVGNLAVGASAAITISGTVSASSGATVTNIAQISASGVSDPDSTPNNGITTEDDYASRSFTVTGARVAGVAPVLFCPAGSTLQTFDWGAPGQNWPVNSLNNNLSLNTVGDTPVGITTSVVLVAGSPVINANLQGGLGGDPSLFLNMNNNTISDVATVIVTLPTAVPNLQFRLFDIDFASGSYADRIAIFGTFNGSSAVPTLTNGVSNYVLGNVAIGDAGATDTGVTSANGNVVVTFSGPVDTITIVYGNHTTAPANPGNQHMSIHDLSFCSPVATLVVDKSSVIVSDPVNGTTSPYRIPGATVRYCILMTNSGSGTTSAVSLNDPLPSTTTFIPGTLRTGATCATATTVEDDDATGADENDPRGASFASGIATARVASIAPGGTMAVTVDALIN